MFKTEIRTHLYYLFSPNQTSNKNLRIKMEMLLQAMKTVFVCTENISRP